MTKWTLPEGRKPLTDADIAALTRRLAGTAFDYKDLYEAAKRDAEEAEAYAAELEAKLQDMALDCLAAQGQAAENFQMYVDANEARIDAEAKIAKAIGALDRIAHASDFYGVEANAEDQGACTLAYAHKSTCNLAHAALAELKGEGNE